MAKVLSIVKISGSIGDLVFCQLNNKTILKTKAQGMSERLKKDPAYEGARERNGYLKIANAIATCIYRMGKEYAAVVNYKVHNILMKRIYPLVKEQEQMIPSVYLGKVLKGLPLNYKETLPIVEINRYEDQLILSCNKDRVTDVSVKVCLGVLPDMYNLEKGTKLPKDMEHVELLELTTLKGEDVGDDILPVRISPQQIVIAITSYMYEGHLYEWVRIV